MKIKLIIPIILTLIMTSCTQVVVDKADEIRMNRWNASLPNGNTASLSFNDDDACLKIKSRDKDARATIKGISIIDENTIFIYNKADNESYCFDYKINNNTLILKYDGGKITLSRKLTTPDK